MYLSIFQGQSWLQRVSVCWAPVPSTSLVVYAVLTPNASTPAGATGAALTATIAKLSPPGGAAYSPTRYHRWDLLGDTGGTGGGDPAVGASAGGGGLAWSSERQVWALGL